MSFSIELALTAEKDLDSLDKRICGVILKKLKKVVEDPLHFLERLSGYTLYKLRVGNYRVILRVDTTNNRLQVIMVDHREKIYKRLQRLIRE